MALDLYTPVARPQTPLPVVVYVFGGGWVVGNKHQIQFIRGYELTRRGDAVVAITYRLTDAGTLPAQIEDATRRPSTRRRRVFHSMWAEVRVILARGGGSIVNVSWTNAVVTFTIIPANVAAKHGVVGLTKAAALENGPAGIRVNAVAPTVVKTPMSAPSMPDELWEQLTPIHALNRLSELHEIAAAV